MKLFTRRLCPVLILHGEEDKTVPVEEAYHLQQILEKKHIALRDADLPRSGPRLQRRNLARRRFAHVGLSEETLGFRSTMKSEVGANPTICKVYAVR